MIEVHKSREIGYMNKQVTTYNSLVRFTGYNTLAIYARRDKQSGKVEKH